jgi:hypothetical protein
LPVVVGGGVGDKFMMLGTDNNNIVNEGTSKKSQE